MVFSRQEEQEYRLLYLGGGAVHGVTQAQVLVFLEELAGIPLAWQYDMIAGDSVGASPAAVLNCPKHKGSNEPRYTAKEYADILKGILQETFEPFRDNYYKNMVTLEIEVRALQTVRESLLDWGSKRDKKANETISKAFDLTKSIGRKLSFKPLEDIDFNNKSSLSFFNLHSGIAQRSLIPLINKRLDKAEERVKNFFFSADHIHDSLDKYLSYDDGSPVMLGDTITGFHSEAFNIDNTKPEAHIAMKPIGEWEGLVSDLSLPLAEAPKRSMPAQTVFKPYYSEHSGCHYDDIASHNTMASAMNAVRRRLSRADDEKKLGIKIKRKGVSIGCGMEPPNIDPKRMGELLILGRLDSTEGAPLLKIPLLFNTSKAIRDLTEELGEDNALFIEKIMDPNLTLNKYRFREAVRKDFGKIGSDLIRKNLEHEASRIPTFNMIDARDEKIEILEEFGWAMVWDHLGPLVNEAKEGLKRAHKHGLIDDEFLQERLKHVNDFMPSYVASRENKAANSFMDYLSFGGRLSGMGLFSRKEVDEAQMEHDPPPQ